MVWVSQDRRRCGWPLDLQRMAGREGRWTRWAAPFTGLRRGCLGEAGGDGSTTRALAEGIARSEHRRRASESGRAEPRRERCRRRFAPDTRPNVNRNHRALPTTILTHTRNARTAQPLAQDLPLRRCRSRTLLPSTPKASLSPYRPPSLTLTCAATVCTSPASHAGTQWRRPVRSQDTPLDSLAVSGGADANAHRQH